MFIVVHIFLPWLHDYICQKWACWKDENMEKKRNSKCSPDNNNNVNAFLTCTAQEASFSSYNSTVNLFSPFSALGGISNRPRVSARRFVSVCLSPSYTYTAHDTACGEKKREVFRHAGDTRTRARIRSRWAGRGKPDATSKWNGHGRGRLRVSREEDALSLLCLAQSFVSIEV